MLGGGYQASWAGKWSRSISWLG